MLKRALSWCSAVLVAGVSIVAPSSAAHADLPGMWRYLSNGHGTLSTAGGSGANGTHAIQWRFHGGIDQQWELVPVGTGSYYYLRNATTWRRLAIQGGSTANLAHAILWNENNNHDQQWRFEKNSSGYFYHVINRKSGKCLGVAGNSPSSGAHAVQFTCNDNEDQLWDLHQSR